MPNLITATIAGSSWPAIPPGCCARVHLIATTEELQDDTKAAGCSACGVVKDPDEFYTRTNGKKMKVCKACFKKRQNSKRDADRRAAK